MSEVVDALVQVLDVIRAITGIDFTRYRRTALLAALARHLGADPPDQLPRLLRADPQRAHALADECLVTATSFFRDPEVFDTIGRRIVPALLEGRQRSDVVRAWCAGCATGEEAYSLAMTLLEAIDRAGQPHGVQVFATDLHASSLAVARDGVYPDHGAAAVGAERLARFFERVPGGYRAGARLRDAITFARHDVTTDAPFTRIDLITCRNVLMYFERALQEQVVELLRCGLTRDGVLVLGPWESAGGPGLVRLATASPFYRNAAEPSARLPALRRAAAPPNPVVRAGTAREELICAREQLSAVLDELRITKQELASTDIELRRVNGEIQTRLDAVVGQARDSEAVLDDAEIALLVLDRASRILRFTPRAQALFSLRASDLGRPLSDLTHRLAGNALDQIRYACLTGAGLDTEVMDAGGRLYLMRARPTPRASIAILFVDITPVRRVDPRPSLYRMSSDWRFMRQLDGRGMLVDTFELRQDWMDVYIDPADRAVVRDAIAHAIGTRSVFELVHRVVTASDTLAWIRSRALPVVDTRGEICEWFGVASSVPEPGTVE